VVCTFSVYDDSDDTPDDSTARVRRTSFGSLRASFSYETDCH
jgi:hypothetical protein